MEDTIIMTSEALYFRSVTEVLKGDLVLTNKRITYSGIQERLQTNHGLVGNAVKDKLEKKLGYDNLPEHQIFDIALDQMKYELKRFGLSKRLIITDKNGNIFKMTIQKKSERNEWPNKIDNAKRNIK
jgi:hypothetical protein